MGFNKSIKNLLYAKTLTWYSLNCKDARLLWNYEHRLNNKELLAIPFLAFQIQIDFEILDLLMSKHYQIGSIL